MNSPNKQNESYRFIWIALALVTALTSVYALTSWSNPAFAAQPAPQSPGDYAFITLSGSNQVAVINVATNFLVNTIDVGAAGCQFPWRAAITPNGSQVYVSCRHSNNVLVIDSNTFAILRVISSIMQADGIAFRRDGQYAFVGSRSTSQVVVVNTNTYFQLVIPTNGNTRSLAAHPFLDLVYVTSSAGEILILDSRAFNLIGSIDVVGEPWDVVVSPDGQRLYTGDRWGQGLSVVDLNTNSVITTLNLGVLTGLEIAPDGSKLYAGRLGEGIYVIDTVTYQAIPVVVSGKAWEMAVTCNGSKLYVGSVQDFVPILDTTTLVVVNLPMPGYGARDIAICPQYVADGVILFPRSQKKQDALGAVITYSTTLHNETRQTDSFGLALAGSTWPTELSTTSLGPLNPGDAATFMIKVTIPTGVNWYDSDEVTVTATSVTSPTMYNATAVLTTEAYAPPQISVAPDSFSSTQLVNSQVIETLTISNGNAVTLTYALDPISGSGMESSLEEILDNLNANYQTIIDVIPNRYDFSEGETGYSIDDGGNDMYDGGNYLSTNLGSNITYSNNVIATGYEFGENGRYFTRKYPGLFVLAADIAGVDFFEVSGNLGADGGGNVDGTILQVQRYGNSYYGFVKRVYNAGDPSVNHLIIVANNPTADHIFSTNSDNDHHRVFNLLANTRLYYLLYAGSNGYYIDDDATLNIMEAFLNTLPVEIASPWLTVSPKAGVLPANGLQDVMVTFDSTNLQPGNYQGSLIINSNDPINGRVNLPASLAVEPTATMGWVEGYITDGRFDVPLQATVIAQGQPYTIKAGINGYYKLWLEPGNYDLHVFTRGYVAQQHSITIVAQQGTFLNIPLVEDVPIFGLTPNAINITHYMGDVADEMMTLDNSGPAEINFAIRERDTTSGLALLAPFARSAAEIAALQTEQADGDEYNQGAPTIAPIPAEAYANLQGSTNLLAWIRYADYNEEYTNSLNAIAQYTSFNLTETDTEDPTVLAALLKTTDVFLIPEQENSYSSNLFTLGQSWASTLQTFVSQGGTIVLLDHCHSTFHLLQGAGLVDLQFEGCNSYRPLEVVDNEHPLVKDVPATFLGLGGLAFYTANDGKTVVREPQYNYTVVMAKDIVAGHVAVIGFDYHSYNDEMARVLANAVQWYSSDVPWLTTTPATGTVPGYAALDVMVSLDATGLQPGVYTANLIIDTNDPYTPTQVLPVSMEVLPTSNMGQVVGAVRDAWTGDPLTATVQIEGVHSITADPTYTIWTEAGTYTLIASADGYMTETITVVILAGGVVTQDLALVPAQSRLEGLPGNVRATSVAGHTNTHSFTLANTGPMALEYAWHEVDTNLRQLDTPLDLSGKSILYDYSHGSYGISEFTFLVGEIVKAGGVVSENGACPITAAVLAPHDILWVSCCGYTSWLPDELAAVSTWLQSGGAIFLYGGDSPAVSDLAALFGIGYLPGSYNSGYTTDILPHATTNGVSGLYLTYAPNALTYSRDAIPLVYDAYDYLVGIAHEENGGRIIVVSGSAFANWSIKMADNLVFALNIFDWLAAPVYTEVPWAKVEPVAGTIPAYADQLFTMTFDAADLAPGVYEMMFALEHTDPAYAPTLFIPVRLEVAPQEASVSIVTNIREQTAVPGQNAAYQIVITNKGNAPDSFAISASSFWTAGLSATNTGLLAVNESFTLTVTVAVPGTAANNSSETTAVTVISVFDPDVTQTLLLRTTALIPAYSYYLPLVVR